ncbi:diacylglycerol kinase family protein [Sphingomonas sp.]|uniref:diacylglycerol kinase family protein n=1 Tax=Sphingomonas sp. TaxID=28214 RepID=UPI0035BBE8EB
MTPDLSLRLEGIAGAALRRSEATATAYARPSGLFRLDTAPLRIGIIRNAKARLNIARRGIDIGLAANCAMPRSHDELHDALAMFARTGVNALVIDGGDGTVRDVLTAAAFHYRGIFPTVAVLPSGKTNALATDLGLPQGWTEQAAVDALRAGRTQERGPLEIWRPGMAIAEHRGFIFGAGAFVRATALAQDTHRLGAFNGLAVGLSVAGAVAQTLFGRSDNVWRRGTPMRIAPAGAPATEGAKYLFFGSTLTRLPLDLRPFGEPRSGLKTLCIDAPPAGLALALPAVLAGYDLPAGGGYRRDDSESMALTVGSDIILDGETFPGGEMTLRHGAPIRFAVP